MERRKRRQREQAAEAAKSWITAIDACLDRFREELAGADVKLADYMRLAELESMAARGGKGEVTVRWVDCDAESET